MPRANTLRFNYDTTNFEPTEPSPFRIEFNYDTGNFESTPQPEDPDWTRSMTEDPTPAEPSELTGPAEAAYDNLRTFNASERGGKAIDAANVTNPLKEPELAVPAEPDSPAAAETAEAKDPLAAMPESVREICLRQREVFAIADKDECSYNLFTAYPEYRDKSALNKSTNENDRQAPHLKEIISEDGFWDDERAALQEYGVTRQFNEAMALSDSMRAAERERGISPTIYVLRGVPGSGKTFACRAAGFPGMIIEDGEPVGTLATDNSKTDLYHAGGTSDQIHAESSLMYRRVKRRWMDHVREQGGDCSEIHDRVFDDPSDIEEVLDNATETSRRIDVLDIDVPYVVSAVRVLLRPKDDPMPHPGDKYMEKTFRKARETRIAGHDESILCDDGDPSHTGQFIKAINHQGLDINYRLLCYDYESEPKVIQREAAHLERDEATGEARLVVTDEKLYRRATDPASTEEEIAKVSRQVIDQEFVDWYCETFFNPGPESEKYTQEVRAALAEYVDRGLTIYQALNDKNL